MKDCLTSKPVNWREVIPPGFVTVCCHCGQSISEKDFEREDVVLWHCGHFHVASHWHHFAAGPGTRSYNRAMGRFIASVDAQANFLDALTSQGEAGPEGPEPV
jgi:hypothetical protein